MTSSTRTGVSAVRPRPRPLKLPPALTMLPMWLAVAACSGEGPLTVSTEHEPALARVPAGAVLVRAVCGGSVNPLLGHGQFSGSVSISFASGASAVLECNTFPEGRRGERLILDASGAWEARASIREFTQTDPMCHYSGETLPSAPLACVWAESDFGHFLCDDRDAQFPELERGAICQTRVTISFHEG